VIVSDKGGTMNTSTIEKEELEHILEKFRRYKEETDAIIMRLLEDRTVPTKSIEEIREELGKQLRGFSVSQMLIEERP